MLVGLEVDFGVTVAQQRGELHAIGNVGDTRPASVRPSPSQGDPFRNRAAVTLEAEKGKPTAASAEHAPWGLERPKSGAVAVALSPYGLVCACAENGRIVLARPGQQIQCSRCGESNVKEVK